MPQFHVVKGVGKGDAGDDFGRDAGEDVDADAGPGVGWARVVVPTRGGFGKSRLVAPPGTDHAELARAIARDTVEAARRCPAVREVVVVTGDETLAAWAAAARGTAVASAHRSGVSLTPAPCRVVGDPATGLAGAIAAGLATLPSGSVAAVLLGDIPTLTPGDLAMALAAARRVVGDDPTAGRAPGESAGIPRAAAFVPDAEGRGTVLLVGRTTDLRPAFGPGSAQRHARHATRLDLDLPRLRRDVDDATTLQAAERLGVGPHTGAALVRRGGAG